MKNFSVFILSFVFLTSCNNGINESNTHFHTDDEKFIMFFSDEENIDKEGNYYDALLELKDEYPDDISKMRIIPLEDSYKYSSINISTYPALVVIEKNKIVKQIDGQTETKEIISMMEEALGNE
ncbi:hypothetical protein [Litchfieldia alkalitelluris]|uniref:hypothetical protein n=1 Tax=Litchfieldia alkalitelluris TaxID=304268 RepID=UPI000998305D|nr:hypothetical protein [Litchfieldia alkalitelluris]